MLGIKPGKWIQSRGGIPVGGSDNNKLWEVFTAGEKGVMIMTGSYWSGDGSEYYELVMCPPNSTLNGTLGVNDIKGTLTIFGGNIEGGVGTQAEPEALFGHYTRTSPGAWFYLPPHYSIAVQPVTAASAADFGVRLAGFECEY